MKKNPCRCIGGFKTYAERKANRAVLKANNRSSPSEDVKKKWALIKKYERILKTGLIPQGTAEVPLVIREGTKENGFERIDEWEEYNRKLSDVRSELAKNGRKKR